MTNIQTRAERRAALVNAGAIPADETSTTDAAVEYRPTVPEPVQDAVY